MWKESPEYAATLAQIREVVDGKFCPVDSKPGTFLKYAPTGDFITTSVKLRFSPHKFMYIPSGEGLHIVSDPLAIVNYVPPVCLRFTTPPCGNFFSYHFVYALPASAARRPAAD